MQPPIVLAADQVQRAAVQPGDDQRLVLQRAVYVSGSEPHGPRPHREPGPARVLRLDREQPLGDRGRAGGRLARQQLRREPPRLDTPVQTGLTQATLALTCALACY